MWCKWPPRVLPSPLHYPGAQHTGHKSGDSARTLEIQTSSDSAMMIGYALTTQSAIKIALSPAKKLPHGGTRRADGAVGDGSSAAPNLEIYRDMAVVATRLNGSSCTKRSPHELSKPKFIATCQDGDQRWPVECWVAVEAWGPTASPSHQH